MSNKTFRGTFAADFKRSLRLPMLFAVLAVIIGFIFDNYNDLKLLAFEQGRENLSVFYYHFNSVSFGGMFSTYLFALIAALPFAAEYAAERQSGMALYLVSRSGVKNYGISKMLTAAIAGGLALCLGSMIFVAVLSARLQLVRPSDLAEHAGLPYYSLLASGGGIPYFFAAWYLLFLTGALWAGAAMCVSAFAPDRYVVIASPFFLCFFMVQFARLLRIPNAARLDMLLIGRAQWGSEIVSLLLAGTVIALLIAGLTFVFCRRMKGAVQNGFC